jgi:hypothetical protein
VAKFARLFELHKVILGRARQAMSCWSMAARPLEADKDIRLRVAKMAWEDVWLGREGEEGDGRKFDVWRLEYVRRGTGKARGFAAWLKQHWPKSDALIDKMSVWASAADKAEQIKWWDVLEWMRDHDEAEQGL